MRQRNGNFLSSPRMLKKKRRLFYSSPAGNKVTLFFLDKDVDDLRRTLRRCQHAIYTDYYSVENYMFRHGDVRNALRIGGCLSSAATETFKTSTQWTKAAAESWAEWIAFCLMTIKCKRLGLPNYSSKSLIHNQPYSSLDSNKKQTLIQSVANRTGKSVPDIEAMYEKELRRVKSALASDTFDSIFNGKWYFIFLCHDIVRLAGGRPVPGGVEERLEGALMAHLDFSTSWTIILQNKITSVLSKI